MGKRCHYQQNAVELKYLCIVREPHVYVPSTCPKKAVPCPSLCLSLKLLAARKSNILMAENVCVNLFIVLINVNSLQLPAIKGRRTSCCNTPCGMWQPVAVAVVRTVRMINAACQATQCTHTHTHNFFLRP